jgi:hypothetical protein
LNAVPPTVTEMAEHPQSTISPDFSPHGGALRRQGRCRG